MGFQGRDSGFPYVSAATGGGTISYVTQATGTSSGATPALASYAPAKIGNALLFVSANYSGGASYYALNSIASTNATWGTPQNYDPTDLSGVTLSMCLGHATSISAANITATYGGSTSSAQMALFEVTGAATPTYTIGTIGTSQVTAAALIFLPSESATPPHQLYVGLCRSTGGIALTLVNSGYTEAIPITNCHGLIGPGPQPEYTFAAGNSAAGIGTVLTGA